MFVSIGSCKSDASSLSNSIKSIKIEGILMKRGTKVGWALVALSVLMSIWVISSQSVSAEYVDANGFVYEDSTCQVLTGYTGSETNITIPTTVTTISAGAFNGNTSIISITMGNNVTTIGSGAFMGCTSLETITLSNTITTIPDNCFNGCESLSSIAIPSSVTTIGSRAFYGCTALYSVEIPAAVTSIASDAFEYCNNLVNITVSSSNTAYSSYDGCLYNASGTILIFVPRGKTEVTVQSGTRTIGSNSFTNCKYLVSVSIPSSVTTIESGAFNNSTITSITIPESVTTIGDQVNWSVNTIYTTDGSTADIYGKTNSITVIYATSGDAIEEDNTSDSQDEGDTSDSEDEDEDTSSSSSSSSSSNSSSTSSGSSSSTSSSDTSSSSDTTSSDDTTDDTTTDDTTATEDTSSDTDSTTDETSTAEHIKDDTPKTADGADARYFFCFAVFLGGVGFLVYSNTNKFKFNYLKNHK